MNKKFAKFGDINYDCPMRDYGSYRWSNKKRKWVRIKETKQKKNKNHIKNKLYEKRKRFI